MAWTSPATWSVGQIVTAANLNTHLRDNFKETAPYKAAAQGNVFYATGSTAIAALGVGTSGQFLKTQGSSANPAWASLTAAAFATAGMPYCLVRNDAATSISNATETVLSWNTDVQDPDSSHNPSSNPSRITPNFSGQYICFCSGTWASNASGVRTLYFRRNGSGSDRAWGHIINPTDGDGTVFSNFSGETLTSNGSTDYFEVVVAQSSGGSLDFAVDGNADSPFFGVIWAGPAAS